jgi:ribosomal 50S subunit-recycling heat shock protein
MNYIPPHLREKQQQQKVEEMNGSTNSNLFPQLINSAADNTSKPKISFATHAIDWGKKKEEERIDGMRKTIREERIKRENEFIKATNPFSHFRKRRPPTAMKPSSNIPLNEEIKVKMEDDGEGEWQVVCNRKTKKPKPEKEMTEEEFNKAPSSEDEDEEAEDTYWRN